MANQQLYASDYVRFSLHSGDGTKNLLLAEEPIGWDIDDLEFARNKKYLGIFTKFTSGLKFRGNAKSFILREYALDGVNANVVLRKEKLLKRESYKTSFAGNTNPEVKFKTVFEVYADFSKWKIKDGVLEIPFNSNALEELIKTHESDAFELDRARDIDANPIAPMNHNTVAIEPRIIVGFGESVHASHSRSWHRDSNEFAFDISPQTLFIKKGMDRHVEVSQDQLGLSGVNNIKPLEQQATFFYDDIETLYPITGYVDFTFNIKVKIATSLAGQVLWKCVLTKWRFDNGDTNNGIADYIFVEDIDLSSTYLEGQIITVDNVTKRMSVGNKFGYSLRFRPNTGDSGSNHFSYEVVNGVYNIKVEEHATYETGIEGSPVLRSGFTFVNEAGGRLMEIITGKRGKFYSKLFGRAFDRLPPSTGAGEQYQYYDYDLHGEQSEVGLIHGMDLRNFLTGNKLYKSMTLSLKDLIDSMQSTFNIGIGIEDSSNGQRLRFEKMDYFFREFAVIKLGAVEDIERNVSADMFFSRADMGFSKGGDYENQAGLDEPNVKTSYVTPIRKSKLKYTKVSKFRGDETGQELIRRKQATLNETEDASGDDHIWMLDLKVNIDPSESEYVQLKWDDVLQQIPTGISSPETFHNWKFTPKRALIRHGSTLRNGLEPFANLGKLVLSESNANINLSTQYVNEDSVTESIDTPVKDLDRGLLEPTKIKFKYPIDDDLLELIQGFTEDFVEGTKEFVPNIYFPISFINENEEIELGYLNFVKIKKGEWEVFKKNDNLINN